MLTSVFRAIAGMAVETVFPSRCVHCRAEGEFLCARCQALDVRLDGPACFRCATPIASHGTCARCLDSPPALDRMIAAYQYDGPVRDAVHALKYDGLRAVAPVLGARMAALPAVSRLEADVMVPVPLHPSRMRSRGYNHAELLAREIGRRTALPVDARALRRIRNTPPQARAAHEKERARQVAGAFVAVGDRVAGKRVLVVDDVATTCSTLDACARALKTAGATRVIGLVLAREL